MQNEITELRNQVRTLKRIVYGFGCLLVAGIVVGATSLQTVPDVIQAKQFDVVNDEGKVVAGMSGQFADGGMLIVANKDGELVATLGANTDGGVLMIANKDGKLVAQIRVDTDGGGGDGMLMVANKDENPVATLVATPYGGMLGIFNREGQSVAQIGAGADGGVLGTFNNKDEVTSSLP